MKNPPIWESASRPLFVKSVWLDAGHRHFILDYEPKQKFDSAVGQRNKRGPVQTSVSYDICNQDDDLLLVGSSKTQFHQSSGQAKSMKSTTGNYRRFSSRKTFLDHFRRRYDLLRDETTSKRSSLYDLNSVLTNNSHSDEKLAERVLNWLDLAGKTPLLRPVQDSCADIDRKKAKKVRSANKLQEAACSRRPDSVKHITIIFNKEGVPVRLNRPARNIDLCAISSSAGAVRRLAGNLASARLYEEGVNGEIKGSSTDDRRIARPRTTGVRKTTTLYDGIGKKKAATERESSAMRDAKRQLHIFMPSLPKKATTQVSEEAVCSDLTNQCTISSN